MPRKTDARKPDDRLFYASADLLAARVLADHQAGFHICRSKLAECLEKVLKAELIQLGWELEKTHDLNRLFDLLIERGSPLSTTAEPLCDALVQVYFSDRYPGFDLDDPDWPKLRQLIQGVTVLLESVQRCLSAANPPPP